MDDEETRAAIYAAMSEVEDEAKPERDFNNPFSSNKGGKTVEIPLPGGKTITVPSVDYVAELERKLIDQARKIEKFERAFHRIDSKLRTQRAHINGQGSRINDVNRELEQKIDRRD